MARLVHHDMVIPIGFEPMASGLGILRSIHLSYGTSEGDIDGFACAAKS
jgi:hypothetical protein